MVQEIGNLVFYFLRIRIFGSDDDLRRLLTDLLQDLVDSLVKQVIRVGTFLRMDLPVLDHAIDILKYLQRIRLIVLFFQNRPIETTAVSGMAGCTDLMYFRKQRVIITVHLQLLHILEMAGSQALHPKFLSAAAEIRHSSTANGCLKCLLIHICDHQHFLCLIVLNYNRHHAVAVFLQLIP